MMLIKQLATGRILVNKEYFLNTIVDQNKLPEKVASSFIIIIIIYPIMAMVIGAPQMI